MDTIAELINILRQNPGPVEKKEIAFELAHIDGWRAYEEFNLMLNGFSYYKMGGWRKLWKRERIFVYGSLDDSLIAIEALGETKNIRALGCLRRMIDETEEFTETRTEIVLEPEYFSHYESHEEVAGMLFKEMCGGLKEKFRSDITDVKEYIEWASKQPEYQLIKKSIKKLESTV